MGKLLFFPFLFFRIFGKDISFFFGGGEEREGYAPSLRRNSLDQLQNLQYAMGVESNDHPTNLQEFDLSRHRKPRVLEQK